MAGVLAEKLRLQGIEVHYVTPSTKVSEWTEQTMEQARIQKRLLELGVTLHLTRELAEVSQTGDGLALQLACTYTGQTTPLSCANLLLVTMRDANDDLYQQLLARQHEWGLAGIKQVQAIGDALAPATIAAAVYAGHKAAREMDAPDTGDEVPFMRETIAVA